jgi:O-antigen/teichoic acid export membrane protein
MPQNTLKDISNKALSASKFIIILKPVSQALSVIATILLVRVLTIYEYGIYNIFYSLISLLSMVASFGLANTLQRYIPEYYKRGEMIIANNLYKTASFMRLLSNVVLLSLILIFWNTIGGYFGILDYSKHFLIFLLIILLYMQKGLLDICLGSFFLQKNKQLVSILFVTLKFIGYTIAILINMNLWFVLIIDLIAYTISFIILQIIYHKQVPRKLGYLKCINEVERKRILRYALFYNFNDAGSGILNAKFDNFILVALLNPIAVGVYSFCHKITHMINTLVPLNYFRDIARPFLFSFSIVENKNEITQTFQFFVKLNCLLTIPMFFFILLYGEIIIDIISGSKYGGYGYLLAVVYLFSILETIPIATFAQLKERADIVLYSKVFAFYNIIADIILIKFLGIWGAVFATGTAVLGKNIFIWSFVHEIASFKGMGPYFLKIVSFWVILYSLMLSSLTIMNSLSVTFFIIGCIIFVISFFIQFRINIFNPSEIKILSYISHKNRCLKYLLNIIHIGEHSCPKSVLD